MSREFLKMVARLDRLPSLSGSVARLNEQIDRGRSNARQLAQTLAEDAPLSARVLRVANSGLYARGGRTDDIATAVTRIGVSEVRGIVTAAAMAGFATANDSPLNLPRLYEVALGCALVMEIVAKNARCMPRAPNGAKPYFTVGLLHDIGLFALNHLERKRLAECVETARCSMRPLVEVEKELFGYTHTDVGAALLQRWRLPAMDVDACKWHHEPSRAPRQHLAAARAVHVAELVVADMGLWPDHEILVPFPDQEAMACIGISMDELPRIYEEAAPVRERVSNLARALQS
jgi:HD-like signal output (HDOD) protein